MAPELFRWQAPTEKSDWYSVGVMLYEALTGSVPRADGVVLAAASGTALEPPSRRVSDVPASLNQMCVALLDPLPERRPDPEEIRRAMGAVTQAVESVHPGAAHRGLVGRRAQLEALARGYATSREHESTHAVLASGESGMGKTALLTEFIARHGTDATVLWGRCHEDEAVSHKAFDEIVDELVRMLLGWEHGQVLELVPIEDASKVVQLFPAMTRVPALATIEREAPAADPRESRASAYEALRRVLCRLAAQRPLIIVIDDLQWGDLDSARLLFELFREPMHLPCLLLLAFRSDEVANSRCLERLLRGSRCLADVLELEQLSVEQLSAADAESLAESLLSQRNLDQEQTRMQVDALCREAQGIPLLLQELARYRQQWAIPSGMAVSLRDVIYDRLARTSEVSRSLYELVCVAGAPISEAVLRTALGDREIDGAVVELEAKGLIRPRASRRADAVETTHAKIREATLAGMSREEQQAAHELLARAYVVRGDSDLEALTRHFFGAGLASEAASWATQSAARASARFAFDHAAELYRRILDQNDDPERTPELQRLLADALADAGRATEAAPILMKIAETSSECDALEYRQRAAEQWLISGHIEQGLAALKWVFDALEMNLPQTRRAALLSLTTARLRLHWRGTDFVETCEKDVAHKKLLRIDACRSSWVLSFISALHGPALQARYLLYALDAGEPYRVALGLGAEAIMRSAEGSRHRAAVRSLQARGWQLARRLENHHAIAFQYLAEGHCAYLDGEWERCARGAEQADAVFTRHCRSSTWEQNTLRFFWANALVTLGRYRELRRRLDAWLLDAEDSQDYYATAGFRLTGAHSLRLAADQPQRAREDIAQALQEWKIPELGVHRFLAELAGVIVLLYEDEPIRAWTKMKALRREYRLSALSRVQLCRIHTHQFSALAELAVAGQASGAERKRHLRQAGVYQKGLEAEGVAWGQAAAKVVQAQRLLMLGLTDPAKLAFLAAIEQLSACAMRGEAESARFRLGCMLGGSEGERMMLPAQGFCFSQGIVNPVKMMKMLAPGQ
jgi:hypothetical protein